LGLINYYKRMKEKEQSERLSTAIPDSRPCLKCNEVMRQRIPGGLRCMNCGEQWSPPSERPRQFNRSDIFNTHDFLQRWSRRR
jgi:hypothetical protein